MAVVGKILVALDPTSETLREAEEKNCQCLVSHHPLVFRPLEAVRADQFPGRLVIRAVAGNINLIAVHTNLDAARDGTNDRFAGLLSLQSVGPLEFNEMFRGEVRYGGMGRVGLLPCEMVFEDLIQEIRRVLGGKEIRVVGDADGRVEKVALCSGSGGSLIEKAIAVNADVYITGDVKYHEAQRAVEAGMALIDVGHFASEQLIVKPLADYLRSRAFGRGIGLQVIEASSERDPFRIR